MRPPTRTALLAIAPFLLSGSAVAQGVTVQQTSDVRLYGGLATLVKLASRFGGGGDMHNITGTTYILGHKMRVDQGDNSTIFDADEGRMTTMNNKQKTYTTMTFDEMAAAMEQAARSAQQERATQQGSERSSMKDSKGEVTFKSKASFDKTGERQKIAGYDAQRNFVTLSVDMEAKENGKDPEQAGTIVFLIDQWTSTDAPHAKATREFQQAYAKKVGQAYQSSADALRAVFASDPRIKAGFESAGKELQKVEGVALRTTTHVVLVPPQLQFDRTLALSEGAAADQSQKAEDKPQGGGLKGFMNRVKSAAEEANKNNKQSDKSSAPPKQATLMTMTDEVQSITVGALASDVFTVPAGYREIKPRQP